VAAALIVVVITAYERTGGDDVRVTGTSTTTTTTSTAPSTTASTTTTTSEPTTTTAGPTSTAAPPVTEAPVDETVPSPAPEPTSDLANARVRLTRVGTVPQPVAGAVWPGDPGALYVASQSGRVYLLKNGVSTLRLDVANEITPGGERGLLGIAFSPDGGTFAVSFTDLQGDNQLVLFAMNGNGTVNTGQRRLLLEVAHPTYANHNGGGVLYGPDGFIYWGLGDGGGGGDPFGNAQNPNTFRGKLVRIDPGSGAAANAHIGLRNPWRFSFDRATSDLYIADVGQNTWEEINWLPAGSGPANFGWNLREGLAPYNGGARPAGNVDPIFVYPHTGGRCSITGGYVYRGANIPALTGAYLFSDACEGGVHALVHAGGVVGLERDLGVNGGSVSSFAEDASGELYVMDLSGNQVLRIDPA
jgi:glucose/arabinose dehydrogenase